jgi:hypothetical protein
VDCKHASQLISQAQEKPLPLMQRIGLRFHLMLCDACTNFSKQLAFLRDAVRQARLHVERDERLTMSRDAHDRILEAMKSQQQSLSRASRNHDQNFTD